MLGCKFDDLYESVLLVWVTLLQIIQHVPVYGISLLTVHVSHVLF